MYQNFITNNPSQKTRDVIVIQIEQSRHFLFSE